MVVNLYKSGYRVGYVGYDRNPDTDRKIFTLLKDVGEGTQERRAKALGGLFEAPQHDILRSWREESLPTLYCLGCLDGAARRVAELNGVPIEIRPQAPSSEEIAEYRDGYDRGQEWASQVSDNDILARWKPFLKGRDQSNTDVLLHSMLSSMFNSPRKEIMRRSFPQEFVAGLFNGASTAIRARF